MIDDYNSDSSGLEEESNTMMMQSSMVVNNGREGIEIPPDYM